MRAGTARHRLSATVVSLVVLAATAMLVLGIGLLVAANAPFDRAFAEQRGAHATVIFDPAKVSAEQLRATAGRPEVVAAAGPFAIANAELAFAADPTLRLPPAVIAGRSTLDDPVDVLRLDNGRWVAAAGEIVLSREFAGPDFTMGDKITTGSTTLTVVGLASSITGTADAWVTPAQVTLLGSGALQMLYRFRSAGDETAVASATAAVTAGMPADAVLGSGSYLIVRQANDQSAAAATPFVIAFAVAGLAVSILIVANVVSGAVLAGYRHIGILKAVGFTPAQVVAVYAGRMLLPASIGGLLGLGAGNLLALPVLNQTALAYQVATVTIPGWANLVAVLALLFVVGAAAVLPALRAGRLPANQALTLGRAPRPGRGRLARSLLAGTRLPRAIGLGLATPLARPARAVGALVAIMLGATTLVLATGLSTSLTRVAEGVTRAAAAPIRVEMMGRTGSAADVDALLQATPGTDHVCGVMEGNANVVGLAGSVRLVGYQGESSWIGYRLIDGRWFTSPDEAVVPSNLLTVAGKRVGDTLTLQSGEQRRTLRITGEIFLVDDAGMYVFTDAAAVSSVDRDAGVERFEVGLLSDVDPEAYVSQVNSAFSASTASAFQETGVDDTITLFLSLIAMLVLLVTGVAALGVFNTTLLTTREQVRDIGILKAIGMSPRQVRIMVVTALAGVGVVAGIFAVPGGILLHGRVLAAMASAAATRVPADFLAVYSPAWLVALAAAGLVIALIGAMVPAGWAARSKAANALRAE